nr:MAG: hypothetical protein [Bacteriophage sp.]UVN00657.1 MAG: hypothetical protein [Bacteriophage sp.]UVN04284.1 MAG: hypothetical protein [Bacteriophage sp.]DAQ45623.1 MAG TPA: hypothetical protein [Caudoviricetes sp.]DAV61635.1 MAG TPA: hypothetical protein [Caudoviricetes sp.]
MVPDKASISPLIDALLATILPSCLTKNGALALFSSVVPAHIRTELLSFPPSPVIPATT